jgi:hemerythrin
MEWKDEYSLGIAEIDEQHKSLLQGFSVVEQTLRDGRGWADTHYAIVELTTLAIRHFSFEEALMRLFGYPHLDDHEHGHRYFFIRLEEIERQALRASAESEMVEFLREWLTRHILGDDRGYAAYILSGAQVVRTAPAKSAACDMLPVRRYA